MTAARLLGRRLEPARRREAFAEVGRRVLAASPFVTDRNFDRIGATDLRAMFAAYDELYFGGELGPLVAGRLDLDLSGRMTRAGGTTAWHRRDRTATITLSTVLLYQSFRGQEREIHVGGCPCGDRLEAAQRIFEHELCYLVEFLATDASRCAAGPFQELAGGLFGHRDHRHTLIGASERVEIDLGLAVGSPVRFEHEGRELRGILARVTRRATVFVPDPQGGWIDSRGARIAKYYVPTAALRPDQG